jgi:hypothetical protein
MAKHRSDTTGTKSKTATKRGKLVSLKAKSVPCDLPAGAGKGVANSDQSDSEGASARNILTIETWNGRRIFALAAN